MTVGQTLTLMSDGNKVIQRRLVAVENGLFFVTKADEFEAAIAECREPVCIGFQAEYVLDLQRGKVSA
jgi:hypothetical protein